MSEIKAVLYSGVAPSPAQEEGFLKFIRLHYGDEATLSWQESDKYPHGFLLRVGNDIYDWSVEGRLRQLKNSLQDISWDSAGMIPLVRDALGSWTPKALAEEIGTVASISDGIAYVSGLAHVSYSEILIFEGGIRGMVQSITDELAGCILFDDADTVYAGSTVMRTGKTAGLPVGDDFLGRTVNALGAPIDGGGQITASAYRTIESPAPAIIDRQPVNKPLETGLLTIDSMFPIGRGQRELIIGDRQTGKTAIAVDTIINQKGKDVICIYVSIGQKSSAIAHLAENLKKHGAMDYTVIVHASAADPASLQYIAPYAGCAMGEYFMEQGRDVLIIYDDLSKHATAYRTLSLLLGRAPGREAFPGDVFYLHSRLLERSAHLSDERGGGSMTALPIVETQAGDVSAYIPTNIISITDGQIFLESDLFFSGQRPAVNVGLSVSRVGGDAQTKAMKKAAGSLRLDLAQYREMEVFSQFSSDLDEETCSQLSYGRGLMQMLRQKQYSPYKHHEMVILLTAALNRKLQHIPENDIQGFCMKFLEHFRTVHPDLCDEIDYRGQLSDEGRQLIIDEAGKFAGEYSK